MSDLFLGKDFIDTAILNANKKEGMSRLIVSRYICRAAMSGMILAFGYLIYFSVTNNFSDSTLMPWAKILSSSLFSIVLISIFFTSSELLTSNMMITTIARYFGSITTTTMMRIMILCFIGNVLGGMFIGALVAGTSMINSGMHSVMVHAIESKLAYITEGRYLDAFIRAIFCNFFINLSMLMVYSGRITNDVMKSVAMFFGVFIFMYLSLEHSVANSVLFSIGIFQDLARGTSHVHGIPALINIAIALIGNFIGGGVLIGVFYAYLNDDRNFKKLPDYGEQKKEVETDERVSPPNS